MDLPHDRSHLLWNQGPTERFASSINNWATAMYLDDQTSSDMISHGRSRSRIIAKESGILSGRPVLEYLIQKHCKNWTMQWFFSEGQRFDQGQEIVTIDANSIEILQIERICMNLITRMSGIASTTSRWCEELGNVSLAATRKTNWGVLDKWAVHVGGGLTHRLDRSDGLMIKENDFSSSKLTLREILLICGESTDFPVVEVVSMDHALQVANAWIDLQRDSSGGRRITLMLDNLGPSVCRKFSDKLTEMGVRKLFILEGSGRVRRENLEHWALSGADLVSSGFITMQPDIVDMTMLVEALQ